MVLSYAWWNRWWYGLEGLGVLNAHARTLPDTGPYNSVQLGMLKQMDQMVTELRKRFGSQAHLTHLTLLLRAKAMAALPEDTAALLRGNHMSSDVALELVRRDMTEYSQLSSGLYGSTDEDLQKDPALKKIHDRLSMAVELHGVLTLAGITPGEREWAQTLVDNFGDLRSLRATPWSEVSWLLGLVELSSEKKEEVDKENEEQGLQVTDDATRTYDNPPTRTELRIVTELFAIGEGAPAIRAQVLSYRMSLDVADELEEMGIHDASQITPADQRRLLAAAQKRVEEMEAEEAAAEEEAAAQEAAGSAADQLLVAEGAPAQTSRALPVFAAAAAKVLPLAARALPRLTTSSKLTSVINGGRTGLDSLSKNVGAMKANAKGAGLSSSSSATATNAKSGLLPTSLAGAGQQLNQFSSTVDSATGAVQSVKGLVNELTPDVEAQVAAIEQEKARLNASLDNVRAELERVDVSDQLGESLSDVQAALERAKAQVAPDPNFGARIAENSSQALQQSLVDQRLDFGGPVGLGSYASNEELVAKASGGVAMYGMNYFATDAEIVLKPYAPILQNPEFVEMNGAVSPFEAVVEKTTSQSRAASFHNTSSNAGISVAQTVSSSKGKSVSGSVGIFQTLSSSGSNAEATSSTNSTAISTEATSSATQESFTASATVIEYIRCPMRSFRIPFSQMELTADAFTDAILVNSIEKGEDFLDNYGSHVSTGRQELGGIFFSTISMTTERQVSEVSLMSAASLQSESIKTTARQSESGGSAGFIGIGRKSATKFGFATSTGRTQVRGRSQASGVSEADEEAQYESYIRCIGPNTPTPEDFAESLFTDTSTWAVTDRGRLEAMVPVTQLLEKTYNQISRISPPDPNVKDLEIAILFIKAAWRRRAKRWGYLLNGNFDVPTALTNLIRSAFPTSLGRVPTLLTALLDSLIIKHTDATVGATAAQLEGLRADVVKVATQIVGAADKARKESNSFPVELSFLDASGVEKQVTKEITALGNENKQRFAAVGLTYNLETDSYIFRATDVEDPAKSDEDLWESKDGTGSKTWADLEEWQRRWINQNREQGGVWTAEDYQLFQRRYFAEDQSGGEFVKHLDDGLKSLERDGLLIFFTAKLSDREVKKTALQRAVAAMFKADWVVLRDLWFEDEDNPDMFDDDELGPEGESLWSKILAGVGLFREMKEAAEALDSLKNKMAEAFPDLNLEAPITAEESAADNSERNGLAEKVAEADEAVQSGIQEGVDDDETTKRAQALKEAATALRRFEKEVIEEKIKLRSDWINATDENQRAVVNYVNTFPDE